MSDVDTVNVDGAPELVLALADDELCIGQNLAWWIAVGPFLEEDLALTSISQDELGHARALYGLLGDDVDALAYGRQAHEYRCAHLTELPCHNWDETLVRHFLYDTAETVRWEALAESSWSELGAVARRALAEERSHLRHASGLLARLLRTESGRSHLLGHFDQFAPLACELFDAPVGTEGSDDELLAAGVITCSRVDQRAAWRETVDEALESTGYQLAWPSTDSSAPATRGRAGQRTEHFAALHTEMVAVLSLDPTAVW